MSAEEYPNKYYVLRETVSLGRPPGNPNPDRAVAVVTCQYWVYPCEKSHLEKASPGRASAGYSPPARRLPPRVVPVITVANPERYEWSNYSQYRRRFKAAGDAYARAGP